MDIPTFSVLDAEQVIHYTDIKMITEKYSVKTMEWRVSL